MANHAFANKRYQEQYFLSLLCQHLMPIYLCYRIYTQSHHSINSSPWIVKHKTRSRSIQNVSVFCPIGLRNINGGNLVHRDPISITKKTDHQSSAFPGGPVVKNLPATAGDARDMGPFPGLGRSPGEVHGDPL